MNDFNLETEFIELSSSHYNAHREKQSTDQLINDLDFLTERTTCCACLRPSSIVFLLFIYCAAIGIIVGIAVVHLTQPISNTTCQMTLRRINKSSLSFSSQPRSLAIGHLNHDPYIDLVVVNSGTNTIGIFMGTPNGTFVNEQTLYSTGIGSYPSSITVADFNNDHHLDIAVANYGTNSILIFSGDGNGVFRNQNELLTDSSRPIFITTDDINDDQMLDIIVVNNGTNSFSIFLGKGDGTFQKPIMHWTGDDSLPCAVALEDFNRDGRLDIVVVNHGTNNIGVALGYGNGTFAVPILYATGHDSHPSSILIEDLNKDNQVDIVVANYDTGNVAAFLGQGNGFFTEAMPYSLELASRPSFLASGHFNGDEYLDIVVIDSDNDRLHILLGYGNGSFNQLTTYDSTTGSRPCFAAIADFNDDNRSDIAVAHQDAHKVLLLTDYFNQPSARQAKYFVGRKARPSTLVLYDFNHDGYLDITVNNQDKNYILILNGIENGNFVRGHIYSTGDKSVPKSICLGDLNRDHVVDMIIANLGSDSIGIFFGQTNGTFSDIVLLSTGIGSSPWFVAVHDLNNDNILDIISANYGTGNIGIFFGYGDGTFMDMIAYSTGRSSHPISFAVADVNHDDYPDIIANVHIPATLIVFLGYGNGTFDSQFQYSFGASAQPFWTLIVDLNGNNELDLVIGDNYLGVIIFLGKGDGSFRRYRDYSTGSGALPYQLVAIDINHDDFYDLIIANTGSDEVYILFGNGDGTFNSTIAYAIGSGSRPYAVAVADLNNDTQLEIIVSLWGIGEVVVLTDYHEANFIDQVSYETGSSAHPTSVTIADVNKDNQTDIVITNSGTDNIQILFGSGNGTFKKPMIYPLDNSSSPQSTIVIDVNHDKYMDIVVVNAMKNTINIIMGDGHGNFGTPAIFPTGDDSHPVAAAAGYFNKDDRLDLVVTNTGTDNIGIYYGYNYRSFDKLTTYSNEQTLWPSSVAVDDLNNDSYVDIIASFATSDQLVVLFGKEDGSFTDMFIYPMKLGSFPNHVVVVDVNNDGNKDIISANFATNNIGLLLGYGNGSFASWITFSTGDASKPRSLAVGDFNHDHRIDLAMVESGQYSVMIFLGLGNGSFVCTMNYSIGSTSNPYAVAIGDFNEDNRSDIVVANAGSSSVDVFLGYGNGSFASPIKYSTSYRSSPTYIAIADFNNDKRSDIAVSTFGGNTVDVLLGYGDGSFASVTNYSTGDGSVPIYLAIDDFNKDAILDIAVANSYGHSIVVLFGFGDGTFLPGKPYSTGTGSAPISLAIGDFDRDRRLDIAVANSQSNTIAVLFGSDYELFSVVTQYSTGDSSQPRSIGVSDFNHDGHMDIAVTNYGTNNLGIFLGSGDGTFGPMMTYSTGIDSAPFSLAIQDFNNDNYSDIAVTNSLSNTLAIFLAHDNGTFVLDAMYATGDRSNPYTITVGDMNNDHQSDLIIACFGTNKIAIFYGQGNGLFGNLTSYPLNYNYNPYAVAVADLNQDQWLDAVVACYNTDRVEILMKMC